MERYKRQFFEKNISITLKKEMNKLEKKYQNAFAFMIENYTDGLYSIILLDYVSGMKIKIGLSFISYESGEYPIKFYTSIKSIHYTGKTLTEIVQKIMSKILR